MPADALAQLHAGVIVVASAGLLSFLAVIALIIYMVFSKVCRSTTGSTNQRSTMGDEYMTAYFYSLLVANAIKAMSVIMNLRWISQPMEPGTYCSVQAGLLIAGNVGASLWSMIIAIHIFELLILSLRPLKGVVFVIVIGAWSFILVDVFIGPVIFRDFYTPFDSHGGDSTTCGIDDDHPTAQIVLEYIPTVLMPIVSLLLLLVTFLHLRGNLAFVNGRLKLRMRIHDDDALYNKQVRDDLDRDIMATVRRMIWFPISYLVLLVPVGVSRFIVLRGGEESMSIALIGLFTYALTGFADVVIFALTRKVVLKDGAVGSAYADLEKQRANFEDEQKAKESGKLTPPKQKSANPFEAQQKKSANDNLPRPLILQGTIEETYRPHSTSKVIISDTSAGKPSNAAARRSLFHDQLYGARFSLLLRPTSSNPS